MNVNEYRHWLKKVVKANHVRLNVSELELITIVTDKVTLQRVLRNNLNEATQHVEKWINNQTKLN